MGATDCEGVVHTNSQQKRVHKWAETRQQLGVVGDSSSLMCHVLPVTVRSYVSILKTCLKHFPMLNAQYNVGAEQTRHNSHKQWVCSQCKLRSTCPDLSIRSSVACFTAAHSTCPHRGSRKRFDTGWVPAKQTPRTADDRTVLVSRVLVASCAHRRPQGIERIGSEASHGFPKKVRRCTCIRTFCNQIPAHRRALKHLLKMTGVCRHCGARQREWISRPSPLLHFFHNDSAIGHKYLRMLQSPDTGGEEPC